MAYQAVNRVGASNSETDKGWQKTVLRDLTEQMSSPPTQEIRPADNERVSASAPDQQPDPALVIQRVGELSITEMDKTILELQKVRAFLVSEGERMRREMAEYIKLSQASIASTKAMSENIANFGSVVAEAGKKPNA
jgi:hypothetical protein